MFPQSLGYRVESEMQAALHQSGSLPPTDHHRSWRPRCVQLAQPFHTEGATQAGRYPGTSLVLWTPQVFRFMNYSLCRFCSVPAPLVLGAHVRRSWLSSVVELSPHSRLKKPRFASLMERWLQQPAGLQVPRTSAAGPGTSSGICWVL